MVVVPLEVDRGVVIGRDRRVDVPVDDPSLSRRHARFTLGAGGVRTEDLNSTNGTFVGGEAVRAPIVLPPGSTVRLGDVRVRFEGLDAWEASHCGLGSHEEFEAEVAEAATTSEQLAVLVLRGEGRNVSSLAWSGHVQRHLPHPFSLALYGGTVLEALLPGRSPRAGFDLAQRLANLAPSGLQLTCGVATWPDPILQPEALVEAALAALDSASRADPVRVARSTSAVPDSIVSVDPRSGELWELVDRVARSRAPVLLLGETGTGKEVIAHELHRRSGRPGGMGVVNCGAIPDNLLESHLFGHVKGAFTGADADRAGVFRENDGGTLFLDEVGELSPTAQVALLRVLETGRAHPVGSSREVSSDVRIVAATNVDLRALCEQGRFRWDLLYRLEVVTLQVPPLRDRPADILPLAEHFLRVVRGRDESSARTLSDEVRAVFGAYSWPGNAREVRNVVQRAAILCAGDQIALSDLPPHVRLPAGSPGPSPSRALAPELVTGELEEEHTEVYLLPVDGWTLKEHVRHLEAALLRHALAATRHNQTEAALLLGIPRRTFVYKLTHLDVHADERVCAEDAALLRMLQRSGDADLDHRTVLAELERRVLRTALKRWPEPEVCKRLGVHPRTLSAKLKS